MTKYIDTDDNNFSSFISDSIQELKKERICYVYTIEQVEIIRKAIFKKLKRKIKIEQNECGYTLMLKKEKL